MTETHIRQHRKPYSRTKTYGLTAVSLIYQTTLELLLLATLRSLCGRHDVERIPFRQSKQSRRDFLRPSLTQRSETRALAPHHRPLDRNTRREHHLSD
jgi:hypothetical protein